MSSRLDADEAWMVLDRAHTGILTTLRRDGMPIALPVWFIARDRTIGLAAPSRTKKVARVRHDARASFLVESGEKWAELEAVHLTGRVEIVTDTTAIEQIDNALDVKYAAYRGERASMPEKTQAHYAGRTFLRFVPDERFLSWDNRRIPLKG